MIIARLATPLPQIDEHGYIPCDKFGKGYLPILKIKGHPTPGMIVHINVTNDVRIRKYTHKPLPGETLESRFGPRRTVIRIQPARATTCDRDVHFLVADGKATAFKTVTNEAPDCLEQWHFKAPSRTGNHWTDFIMWTEICATEATPRSGTS